MVDLSTCPVTSSGYWTGVGWHLFQRLIQPKFVVPLLASLVAVTWMASSWQVKRVILMVGVLAIALYGLMLTPLATPLASRGLALMIPADRGEPADAIVILGRGGEFRPSRVQMATDLWRQGRAPLIFSSGRGDAIELNQMLEAAGVPDQALDGEPCSQTTDENAEFTAALLQPQGIKRVILVTDLPHMPRSVLTFRSFGFDVIPHPSPVPPSLPPHRQKRLVLYEWSGLVGYGLLGRYFSRDVSNPGFAWQTDQWGEKPLTRG